MVCVTPSIQALILATSAIVIGTVPATAFTYQLDPDSSFSFLNATTISETGPNKNTYLIQGLEATNFGSTTRSIDFVTAFIAPLLSDKSLADTRWNNTLGGWFTDNFEGTSLLITPLNAPKRIKAGDVATVEGDQPEPLFFTFTPTAESEFNVPLTQTLLPTDELPALELGLFSPGETKTFDVGYQFKFGDDRQGTRKPFAISATVKETSKEVPAPSLLLGVMMVGGVMLRGGKSNCSFPATALPT
jgi:hypothetical protein